MPYIQYCEQCEIKLTIYYPEEGGPLEGEFVSCDACDYVFQVRSSSQPGAKGSSVVEKLVSQFSSAFSWRDSLGSYSLSTLMMVIVFLAGALVGDRIFLGLLGLWAFDSQGFANGGRILKWEAVGDV